MESFEKLNQFRQAGRFSDALCVLEETKPSLAPGHSLQVPHAELLEAVGQHRRAATIASSLLRAKNLKPEDKSVCEYILGKILVDEGAVVAGMDHLQRATSHARDAKALRPLFTAQLKLMSVVSERSGPEAAAALLADVRHIAIRLGDPHVTAQLHLYVAEMEAKRGLLDNARRHSAIARAILGDSPNSYLEAFCSNLELAISVLLCQFDHAEACGERAFKSAELSGVAKLRRAVLSNMASLFCEIGQFGRATEYFERALAASEISGTHSSAIYDGLARVRLLEGDLAQCAELLEKVECSIQSEESRTLYGYRYAALTRAHLLAAQGNVNDAIDKIQWVSALATSTGDAILLSKAELTRAALLLKLGRVSESLGLLQSMDSTLVTQSPEIYANTEQVLACALLWEGNLAGAEIHRDRANRIYESINNVTGRVELERTWADSRCAVTNLHSGFSAAEAQRSPSNSARVLHGVAAAMADGAPTELVAREFVELLLTTGCVYTARAMSRTSGTLDQAVSSELNVTVKGPGDGGNNVQHATDQRLAVGTGEQRATELVFTPKSDVESVASLRAVRLLLNCIEELRQARKEREHKATLWPIEDLPNADDRKVVSGQMHDLMDYARRIARTKVNVLITGESGTGKEIVARAIHEFSDRATKPFVPFNCTAIPRDLLESQLFGHRRGAFTGADRDQLGLIRAAREGTLFLDEIGELGLDLQPKLLRFLESGEIAPLGEPSSLTVDVRIVAATNSNLEDAVRGGRFREDLFYRLNVVRLSIPPLRERRDEIPGFVNHFLARAADEFKKGQVRVAEETMERLLLYRWPGNVRQLQNEMRRMVALADADSTLLPDAISEEILEALPIFRHPSSGEEIAVDLNGKLTTTIARVEEEMIKAALRRHNGKVETVAKALGISRKGLYLKRQRLGL